MPLITNKDQDWLFNADNIIKQVDPEVYSVSPANRFALYQVGMHNSKKETTRNPVYFSQHDVLEARTITLGGVDYAGGAATTTYAAAANNVPMFQVGAIWRNMAKSQNLVVTGIVGNTISLSVEPNASVATVTTPAANDVFKYLFYPHEEGAVIRNPQMTQVTQLKNAICIYAEPWGITAQMEKTLTYTGPEFARQHQLAIERHKDEGERLLWFSTFADNLFGPSGELMYKTSGVFEMSTQNGGSNTTYTVTDLEDPSKGWALFDAHLKNEVFAQGVVGRSSDQYVAFCDDAMLHSLMTLAAGNPRFNWEKGVNQDLHLTYRSWESAYGTVKFIRAPVLNGTKGVMVTMDDSLFKCRQLQPTYLMSNIQNPRAMRKEAALVTAFGAQYAVPETLAVWRGV